jgi:hypothetical protein
MEPAREGVWLKICMEGYQNQPGKVREGVGQEVPPKDQYAVTTLSGLKFHWSVDQYLCWRSNRTQQLAVL